ncbi:MAG: hypothetical protein ACLFVQ_11670, partial [Chitinispirillaceae bacterium]
MVPPGCYHPLPPVSLFTPEVIQCCNVISPPGSTFPGRRLWTDRRKRKAIVLAKSNPDPVEQKPP